MADSHSMYSRRHFHLQNSPLPPDTCLYAAEWVEMEVGKEGRREEGGREPVMPHLSQGNTWSLFWIPMSIPLPPLYPLSPSAPSSSNHFRVHFPPFVALTLSSHAPFSCISKQTCWWPCRAPHCPVCSYGFWSVHQGFLPGSRPSPSQ